MGYWIQFLSFFLKNTHIVWLKHKKPVLGAHFTPFCGSIGPIVSKNNRFTHEWTRTNHVNFMNQNCDLYRNFLYSIPSFNSRYDKRTTFSTIFLRTNHLAQNPMSKMLYIGNRLLNTRAHLHFLAHLENCSKEKSKKLYPQVSTSHYSSTRPLLPCTLIKIKELLLIADYYHC